ncbi:bifunctional proline dehydrogenase/L-glutamate gamma-semialdehyde dehydrogenase PutA [Pleomorphomonas sp. JP5]|uniref:bifunctional proline dehydrogenase/L-glutamate gamma-semialdehyde dehydrogenase PutA n=1 Tax=Pleomorphomonas sp. JP5 TaxID=2942998 RepID=UPI00204379EC|nr:bifunctional proline dehydrogenase/L-glutamate gamma-semialdehyde dehydrogenase PutA [Pleomorphomonas sp. JP5]MCM5556602.1 bifunctional proline dehydrogenase/L-glutamate gamma-semialdehyde dehydrogenase PutA [Pleomorphomonas sp. JP5]
MSAVLSEPHRAPCFSSPYAEDEAEVVRRLLAARPESPEARARVDAHASHLITAIRDGKSAIGGVEDFLKAYSLTTREGLAIMVMAEALLRVPDGATADKLIEDKLASAAFGFHGKGEDPWLVAASGWALGVTTRVLQPGETPENVITGLVKRLGMPPVRAATRQAMKIMGHQFVLGTSIEAALSRARGLAGKGYRHSYDMLGEGARTAADATRYFADYSKAIEAIGRSAGSEALPARPGISVKLSALHPRYEALNAERVMAELVPKLLELSRAAKAHDLNLTVDAEEADRLKLSLDVIAAVAADPSLAGWDGFGLAVQAYQKRAPAVIDYMIDLAGSLNRRFMVRLVKGAYWDTEMKRGQERGLDDYPLFTRKASTDLSYLVCADKLLRARPGLYPQFATHNALTVAEVSEIAGADRHFEFQRLHGMGDTLYREVTEKGGQPCRIYAPVGGHKDLLAYLVRRLLENGANSSFVAAVGDTKVEISTLLKRPADVLDGGDRARHARIPLPADLFGARRNSRGVELADEQALEPLLAAIAAAGSDFGTAASIIDGADVAGSPRALLSPVDGKTEIGKALDADAQIAAKAVASTSAGFRQWSETPVEIRASALERVADLLEDRLPAFLAVLGLEAGKTLADGIAEVREAVDFCRYYAAEARRLFASPIAMPGPTGEENRLAYRGRGVFAAIAPWNFPLAIFMGQTVAALAAGNAVVAKPAEQTPLTGAMAVRLLHEAGVPVSALALLVGDGTAGAALTADPRIAGVAFTGSTDTAFAINRALAAKRGPIVPLIAETGGLNAMIVDATALGEQVTDDVITSAFRSAGQRCSALRLLFVQDDVADHMIDLVKGAAAELKVGDPRRPDTDVGPIIDREQVEKLAVHVAAWQGKGSVLLSGDVPDGALAGGTYFAPTIIELPEAAALDREVFGPVLHVVRYKAKDLDKIIEDIAASGYGLTLGIHSRIEATVKRIVERLPVGNVYVNRNMIGAVVGSQPFGGSGLSGTGPKAGGPNYLTRFALEQVVSINTAAAGGNATLVAMGDD